MGGFRRFVLFVFSLAGIACLLALALPWFGLYGDVFATLGEYEAYYVAVEVCLAMTGAWLAWNLLRSLFSRRHDAISVMVIDGGQITVTKSAVASQASHIVEEGGLGLAKSVDVLAGSHGPVRVNVKVTPHQSVDVQHEAPLLHEALVAGLTAMCGERLGEVDIEFLEAEEPRSLVADATYEEEAREGGGPASAPSAELAATALPKPVPAGAEAPRPADADTTGDITIPMRGEREE